MDGTAGRRASLPGGPDVRQAIRALREVPAEGFEPVETVCIESDLHARQIKLALEFYEVYPDEVEAMIVKDAAAVKLIDEMIAEREKTIAQVQKGRSGRAKSRDSYSGPKPPPRRLPSVVRRMLDSLKRLGHREHVRNPASG